MNQVPVSRRRPRILILVKGLGLGGVERLLSQAIPLLSRDEYDYEVCYFTPWKNDVVADFEGAGIPVHCLQIHSDISPAAFSRLWKLMSKGSYDLIHTHSPYPSSLARVLAPLTRTRAVIHTEHSLPASRKPLTRWANTFTYPLCELVISVSEDIHREVTRQRLFRPKRAVVIHGGIDPAALERIPDASVGVARQRLEVPPGHAVVGNVAHLRSQKGHDVFLRTARRVLDARPETTFVIVGREKEPGYEAALVALADDLGIRDRVRFTGFQPDPYPIVATFDVFLMTSNYEGFPIALVEAMAMGVPVVATDVGGVSEAVIDGQSGSLAPKGDVESLATAVVGLLSDDRERRRLSEAAKRAVLSEFTLSETVDHVESCYEAMLEASREL